MPLATFANIDQYTMNDTPTKDAAAYDDQDTEFAQLAEAEQIGFFAEFWEFLKYNKKWWMTPLILAILVLGVLVAVSATGAAPFIYALF